MLPSNEVHGDFQLYKYMCGFDIRTGNGGQPTWLRGASSS